MSRVLMQIVIPTFSGGTWVLVVTFHAICESSSMNPSCVSASSTPFSMLSKSGLVIFQKLLCASRLGHAFVCGNLNSTHTYRGPCKGAGGRFGRTSERNLSAHCLAPLLAYLPTKKPPPLRLMTLKADWWVVLDGSMSSVNVISNMTTPMTEPSDNDKPIPEAKRKRLEMLLMDGKTAKEAAYIVQTRRQDATIVKRELEAEGKLDLTKVKKQISENLADFAVRASERLKNEVDNMPLGKLAIDTAIAIDKLRDLAEGQQVVVEKKITFSQDEINNLLSMTAQIKTTERKSLDSQQ